MSVELVGGKTGRFTMGDMFDGQICEIIDNSNLDYKGRIVQYIGRIDSFHVWVSIGKHSGNSWANSDKKCDIEVRPLSEGEMLIITNNQEKS